MGISGSAGRSKDPRLIFTNIAFALPLVGLSVNALTGSISPSRALFTTKAIKSSPVSSTVAGGAPAVLAVGIVDRPSSVRTLGTIFESSINIFDFLFVQLSALKIEKSPEDCLFIVK